jgi:hypothetical protein
MDDAHERGRCAHRSPAHGRRAPCTACVACVHGMTPLPSSPSFPYRLQKFRGAIMRLALPSYSDRVRAAGRGKAGPRHVSRM